MTTVFLAALVWVLLALALGVVLGRAIERADAERPKPDDFAQWEAEQRHPSSGWVA